MSAFGDIRKRILDGETADVIILSRPVMEELDKQGKFTSGSITNIAGTPVALAIHAGAPKPDISTVDALKSTLLAAKSIAYADPAKGLAIYHIRRSSAPAILPSITADQPMRAISAQNKKTAYSRYMYCWVRRSQHYRALTLGIAPSK